MKQIKLASYSTLSIGVALACAIMYSLGRSIPFNYSIPAFLMFAVFFITMYMVATKEDEQSEH